MVGRGRVELPTSRLSGVRSNHLSYRPVTSNSVEPHSQSRRQAITSARGARLMFGPLRSNPKYERRKRNEDGVKAAIVLPLKGAICSLEHQSLANQTIRRILRKEVIQPQVPLRLPCYDFTPVMNHTVVIALPKVRLTTSGAIHSHGVTGGVYKARERIHRGMLIHDY